jgi:hypothetical protein
MESPHSRFTIKRLMIAMGTFAMALSVELAVFDSLWHTQTAIIYIERPPWPIMIAVAAVPGMFALSFPRAKKPASK